MNLGRTTLSQTHYSEYKTSDNMHRTPTLQPHLLIAAQTRSSGPHHERVADPWYTAAVASCSIGGCDPSSGRVLTYFDQVGTVGMERDYSRSFVPFQAVCVHTEFPGSRATDPNRKYPGVPTRGQRVLLTQRMNFRAKIGIAQSKPQSRRCEPSKAHLR